MAGSMRRPTLRVEGRDDMHAIIELMKHRGLDFDADPTAPRIPEPKGVDALLDSITLELRLSEGYPVGFVLDGNTSPADRWRSVRDRLSQCDIDVPAEPPAEGFVGETPTGSIRVGVWLMPDNSTGGTLEDFLKTLIAEGDPLIGHAEESSDRAHTLGADFPHEHRSKAILHTWLAWQRKPGRPFGVAIRARYFTADSPAARTFAAWFMKLYRITG